MATDNLIHSLRKYFAEEVTMRREETKNVIEDVVPIIHEILKQINKIDQRFGRPNEVKHAGSYYQGLKVKQADEFDFTVPMTSIGTLKWASASQPYYKFNRPVPDSQNTVPQDLQIVRADVPLPSPPVGHVFTFLSGDIKRKHSDVMFDDHIIPFLVRRLFKGLVTQAIRDLGLRDKVRICKLVHGPAITLKINVETVPFEISVDLAPMCEAMLPFPSSINWPRLGAKWPSSDKIHKIRVKGINQVAKKDFYWTLSFSECEKELTAQIDAEGGVRKKCLRIMKSLRERLWCPHGVKQVLTSFHLKNIVFWECERFPDSADWEEDRLAERFLGMTRRLLDHIRQGQLPMYFHPGINLIKKDYEVLGDVANRLEKFLQNAESEIERLTSEDPR